jgi:hypothetical protein
MSTFQAEVVVGDKITITTNPETVLTVSHAPVTVNAGTIEQGPIIALDEFDNAYFTDIGHITKVTP